jgi:putative ABC transport system permease protein
VLRLVIGQGLMLVVGGVAVGIAGALVLTRLLSTLLFGIRPTDPLAFAAAPILLILTAIVASYLPARRASRVDPGVALRAQ